MFFTNTYRVSSKLQLVPADNITAIERDTNLVLPVGYHEFITTLGIGTYCDLIRIYSPQTIWERTDIIREWWRQQFRWDLTDVDLCSADIQTCWVVADTLDGDNFIVCPSHPQHLYCVPRHGNRVASTVDGLTNLLPWLAKIDVAPPPDAFTYFEPWHARQERSFWTQSTVWELKSLTQAITTRWNQPLAYALYENYADSIAVLFFPSIGGYLNLWQSVPDDPEVLIHLRYDLESEQHIDTLANILYKLGFTQR